MYLHEEELVSWQIQRRKGIMSEGKKAESKWRNQKENQYLFSYRVPRIIGSSDMGSSPHFAV